MYYTIKYFHPCQQAWAKCKSFLCKHMNTSGQAWPIAEKTWCYTVISATWSGYLTVFWSKSNLPRASLKIQRAQHLLCTPVRGPKGRCNRNILPLLLMLLCSWDQYMKVPVTPGYAQSGPYLPRWSHKPCGLYQTSTPWHMRQSMWIWRIYLVQKKLKALESTQEVPIYHQPSPSEEPQDSSPRKVSA